MAGDVERVDWATGVTGEGVTRVCFVLPGYPKHAVGGYKVIYEYANGLAARDSFDVTVLHLAGLLPIRAALKNPRLGFESLKRKAIEIRWGRRMPTWQKIDSRVNMRYAIFPHRNLLRNVDVAVASSWATAFVVAAASPCIRKLQVVQHYEIWSGPSSMVNRSLQLPIIKLAIAKWLVDLIVHLTEDERTAKIFYVPNGIPQDLFYKSKPIEDRCATVISQYNPVSWKGPTVLIAIANSVVEHGYRMIVFGTATRPTELDERVNYYASPSPAKLRALYNSARIYLCTSETEGWHLPPAEAMACGCALVSTDIPGVTDYVSRDEAVLVPVGNPDLLQAELLNLLKDPDRSEALARRGNKVMQSYTWPRAVDSLVHIIEQSEDDQPQYH